MGGERVHITFEDLEAEYLAGVGSHHITRHRKRCFLSIGLIRRSVSPQRWVARLTADVPQATRYLEGVARG